MGENHSPQLAANFHPGACRPAAPWRQLRPVPAQPKAGDPWTPLCSHATSSPSASAIGSAFKIYPTLCGHNPGPAAMASCRHCCPLVAASPLGLLPTAASNMWSEGSCWSLRWSPRPLHTQLRLPPHGGESRSLHHGPQGLHDPCPPLPSLPPVSPCFLHTPATQASNLPPGLCTFCALCLKCLPCQLSTQLL